MQKFSIVCGRWKMRNNWLRNGVFCSVRVSFLVYFSLIVFWWVVSGFTFLWRNNIIYLIKPVLMAINNCFFEFWIQASWHNSNKAAFMAAGTKWGGYRKKGIFHWRGQKRLEYTWKKVQHQINPVVAVYLTAVTAGNNDCRESYSVFLINWFI